MIRYLQQNRCIICYGKLELGKRGKLPNYKWLIHLYCPKCNRYFHKLKKDISKELANMEEKIYICNKCRKEHKHYHIHFLGGYKIYDECFNCCELCAKTRKHLKEI